VVNDYLVRDLKARGLWDEVMVNDLKHYDGSLSRIDRVPADLRSVYATAFEVDPTWLVECASRRQKWIDQAQSLNIYMAGASGKKLHETYSLAWLRGLKTTYYLRTLGATSAEKSTTDKIGQLNAVSASGSVGAFSYSTTSNASATTTANVSNAANAVSGTSASAASIAAAVAASNIGDIQLGETEVPKFCAIDDPDCEACQ
jgi:ribonucleoside-diphosphate reductase alpha chain